MAPVESPKWGYVSFEWVPVPGSKIERNIIISHPDGGRAYAERPKGKDPKPNIEKTEMDANLYYHPTDAHWMDEHLKRMRAVGQEKASTFGDPQFADPGKGDFRFKPGSPALPLGIEELDVSKMGRQNR